MYTKRDLILAAFDEIGLGGQFNVGPEDLQLALRTLDRMMATWEGVLPLGYAMPTNPQDSDIAQDSGLRDEANEAVILNLACKIAPAFGKQIMPSTASTARQLYTQLLREAVMPTPTPMPSTMPLGAGNKSWRGGSNTRFFPEPAPVIEADGTTLEF